MSGEWKRGTTRLVRHRQTKGPEPDRPSLNNRATPRLYSVTSSHRSYGDCAELVSVDPTDGQLVKGLHYQMFDPAASYQAIDHRH